MEKEEIKSIAEDIKQITDVKELQRLYIELNDEMERLEAKYDQQSRELEELKKGDPKSFKIF